MINVVFQSNESQNNISAVSSPSPMNKLASSSVQEKEGAVGGPQEADEGKDEMTLLFSRLSNTAGVVTVVL